MDTVRAAALLLQDHMLFIDHYVPISKGQRWGDIPGLNTTPIIRHIDNYRRSFELQNGTSTAIEQAALQLLRYKGVIPSPTVPFLELVTIFTNHMHNVSSNNQVSGRYMLQALCFFYRIDKIEAFVRFVGPLVQYRVIRNASTLRPQLKNASTMRISISDLVKAFEEGTFSANNPTTLPPRLQLSNVLPRLTTVFCYLTKKEGESEIMFLSHNLMTFARLGEDVNLGPVSLGPLLLRRCWLGASWFFGQKCLSPQSEQPFSNDVCAIVSSDDAHLAVINLCSTNNPGKLPDREWAPVFVGVGFPIHIHPTTIQSGVKQILDVLDMRYGPREQLPYQASGDGDPVAFRELCHAIGKTVYDLVTAIFFQPGNPQSEIVPRAMLSGCHSPLGPLNGSYLSFQLNAGFQRKVGGLPNLMTDFSGFLTPNYFLQSMSPKTLASASRIMLLSASFAQTAAQLQFQQTVNGLILSMVAPSSPPTTTMTSSATVGGSGGGDNTQPAASPVNRLACAVYYHGNIIIADTHPYIARLLWLAASAWQTTSARKFAEATAAAAQANNASSLLSSSSSSRRNKNTVPVALPLNYLHPKGTFAEHTLKPRSHFYTVPPPKATTAPADNIRLRPSASAAKLDEGGPLPLSSASPSPSAASPTNGTPPPAFAASPGSASAGSPASPTTNGIPMRPSTGTNANNNNNGGSDRSSSQHFAASSSSSPHSSYSFCGALQGSGAMKHCSMMEVYLTLQDVALLWHSSRGTNAHNTNGTGPRPFNNAPAPEGWHPAVHMSHNGIDIIVLFQSDLPSANNNINVGTNSNPSSVNASAAARFCCGVVTNTLPSPSSGTFYTCGVGGAHNRHSSEIGTPPTPGTASSGSPLTPQPAMTNNLLAVPGASSVGSNAAGGGPLSISNSQSNANHNNNNAPPFSAVRSRIHAALPSYTGPIIEEIQVLRHSIVKNDVIRRPKSIPTANGGTKQRKLPETVGYVHNKTTASSTFLEGGSSAASSGGGVVGGGGNSGDAGLTILGESANDGFTAANLQRSCQLVSEASAVAKLLGSKMHNNPTSYYTQSLASKPITRVVLGRSAFGDYGDKPGVFNVIYGKETAGQQCVVGTASTVVGSTLRNAEDQYLLFAGACAKNNIPIV